MKRLLPLTISFTILVLLLGLNAAQSAVRAAPTSEQSVFLPLITRPEEPPAEPMVEFRGLWVSRFDWTSYGQPADPAKVDEIVQNATDAGFNVLFFQVRGIADALYASNLEPWSERVSGTYGQHPDPLWDPLATLIDKAHAAGLQVHAYMNVYPVWNGGAFCDNPPSASVTPTPLYHQLLAEYGSTDGKPNGLMWHTTGDVYCGAYMRGTPASTFLDDHLLAVAADIVTRYDVDGLHLDHIRYGGSTTSCDPVSETAAGVPCFTSAPDGYASYEDWQRAQVNGTVAKFYNQIVPLKEDLWLSAAVWPIYIDYWGWGGQEGYHNYFQDSKAWLAGEYIDSISPMIYPGGSFNCPDDSFWTQTRWGTLVNDFQDDGNGRFVIPGIGAGYCTFDEIEARIQLARDARTAGHAIFSYSGLLANSYFDDLANGPYAETAVVPEITWRP